MHGSSFGSAAPKVVLSPSGGGGRRDWRLADDPELLSAHVTVAPTAAHKAASARGAPLRAAGHEAADHVRGQLSLGAVMQAARDKRWTQEQATRLPLGARSARTNQRSNSRGSSPGPTPRQAWANAAASQRAASPRGRAGASTPHRG